MKRLSGALVLPVLLAPSAGRSHFEGFGSTKSNLAVHSIWPGDCNTADACD